VGTPRNSTPDRRRFPAGSSAGGDRGALAMKPGRSCSMSHERLDPDRRGRASWPAAKSGQTMIIVTTRALPAAWPDDPRHAPARRRIRPPAQI
jgi:hypothetical protein